MPDQNGATEDVQDAGTPATPDANAAATQNGAIGGESDPSANPTDYAALSDDEATRAWLEKQGLDGVSKIAKKAYELDKFVGGALKVPKADAPDAEWDAFYAKAGRPDSPDKYEFNVPDSLPETLPYDERMATGYKDIAHKFGLNPKQAAGLHDWFVGQMADSAIEQGSAAGEKLSEIAKAEAEKLSKVWGVNGTESAKRNAAFADKALSAGPPTLISSLTQAGVLGPNKEVLNADFGILLSTLGAAIYGEDQVLRGNPTAVGNPFEEGPNFNVTKQMELVKKDRAHAEILIAAAGKQPADFGLK